ncbi:MAG: peptidase S1C Do [Comamonadaceae bacterium]|nr:MAG: peptidase S1C Do [Comamonadaceae bacterium]
MQIDQVSKEVAESIGLGKPHGALVRGVEKGAPADKAGVEAGDIIVKFDGKPVEKSSDLPRMVGSTKPGTKSTLTVFRRGSTKDLSVVIAEIEAEKTVAKTADKPAKSKEPTAAQALGLTVSDLTDAAKKELGVNGGVQVDAVTDAAARAGLREGDVILAVANVSVGGVKELEAVLAKLDKAKAINVLFRRGEWAQYTVIRPNR